MEKSHMNPLSYYNFIEERSFEPHVYGVQISDDDKIISVTEDGSLLGKVELDIENNVLSLIGKDGEKFSSAELPLVDVIKNAYYDEESTSLIIVVGLSDGTEKEIKVPFNDLLDDYAKKEDVIKNTEAIEDVNEIIDSELRIDIDKLEKGLSDEVNNRIKGDEEIQSQLSSLDIKINDEINKLESFDNYLENEIKNNKKSISKETIDRIANDTNLYNALNKEIEERSKAVNGLSTQMQSISTKLSNDLNVLNQELNKEKAEREKVDNELSIKIENEINRAQSSENEINIKIDNIINNNDSNYQDLSDKIKEEAVLRENADNALMELINDSNCSEDIKKLQEELGIVSEVANNALSESTQNSSDIQVINDKLTVLGVYNLGEFSSFNDVPLAASNKEICANIKNVILTFNVKSSYGLENGYIFNIRTDKKINQTMYWKDSIKPSLYRTLTIKEDENIDNTQFYSIDSKNNILVGTIPFNKFKGLTVESESSLVRECFKSFPLNNYLDSSSLDLCFSHGYVLLDSMLRGFINVLWKGSFYELFMINRTSFNSPFSISTVSVSINNGEYKIVSPYKSNIILDNENISSNEVIKKLIKDLEGLVALSENVVLYDKIDDNIKAITLNNSDIFRGKTKSGDIKNLLNISNEDKVELGDKNLSININGNLNRPTYNTSNEIALLSDIVLFEESLSLEKVSELEYELKAGDNVLGTIQIPKDQFLQSVLYDEETKTLKFVFETTEGVNHVDIDMSSLVDTYQSGDGLTLVKNKFSILLDSSVKNNNYLSISDKGLKIVGIDEKFSNYLTSSEISEQYSTKKELNVEVDRATQSESKLQENIDNVIGTEADDENTLTLNGVHKLAEINLGKITEIETNIGLIDSKFNNYVTVEASTESHNQLSKDLKNYTDNKVNDEKANCIIEAVNQSKEYTNTTISPINQNISDITNRVSNVEGRCDHYDDLFGMILDEHGDPINLKFYTKDEIDSKVEVLNQKDIEIEHKIQKGIYSLGEIGSFNNLAQKAAEKGICDNQDNVILSFKVTSSAGLENGYIFNIRTGNSIRQTLYWKDSLEPNSYRELTISEDGNIESKPFMVSTHKSIYKDSLPNQNIFSLTTEATSEDIKTALTDVLHNKKPLSTKELDDCLLYGYYILESSMRVPVFIGWDGQAYTFTMFGLPNPIKPPIIATVSIKIDGDTYSVTKNGSKSQVLTEKNLSENELIKSLIKRIEDLEAKQQA